MRKTIILLVAIAALVGCTSKHDKLVKKCEASIEAKFKQNIKQSDSVTITSIKVIELDTLTEKKLHAEKILLHENMMKFLGQEMDDLEKHINEMIDLYKINRQENLKSMIEEDMKLYESLFLEHTQYYESFNQLTEKSDDNLNDTKDLFYKCLYKAQFTERNISDSLKAHMYIDATTFEAVTQEELLQ